MGNDPPAPPLPQRLQVHQSQRQIFTAYRSPEEKMLATVHGDRLVRVDDWVIFRSGTTEVVEIVPPSFFPTLYAPVEDGIWLTGAAKGRLEQVLGPGATATGPALAHAVDRLASIRIGGVVVEFTPGQLAEIAHRAKKRGLTPQEELERIVKVLSSELFWGVN